MPPALPVYNVGYGVSRNAELTRDIFVESARRNGLPNGEHLAGVELLNAEAVLAALGDRVMHVVALSPKEQMSRIYTARIITAVKDGLTSGNLAVG